MTKTLVPKVTAPPEDWAAFLTEPVLDLGLSLPQRLNLALLAAARVNDLDGPKVVNDLLKKRTLWVGCVSGTFWKGVRKAFADDDRTFPAMISDLIPLRDVRHDIWHADTVLISTDSPDKAKKLARMKRRWHADDVQIFDYKDNDGLYFMGEGATHVVRFWWD